MKLLKVIKIASKNTNKAQQQRTQLVEQIAVVSNSAHEVAKTVHANAWERWTDVKIKELKTAFKKESKQLTTPLPFSTLQERQNLIVRVASEIGRSPKATLYRLREERIISSHIRIEI